jgi:hypothetical protein
VQNRKDEFGMFVLTLEYYSFSYLPAVVSSLNLSDHVRTELQKGGWRAWFIGGWAFEGQEGDKISPPPLPWHHQMSVSELNRYLSLWQWDAEELRNTDNGNCVTAIWTNNLFWQCRTASWREL